MDYNVLDLTADKGQTFEHLRDAIIDGVLSTQVFIIRPLPSVLLLTQRQFDILKPEGVTPQDQMLWRTYNPKDGNLINLMDIWVKGVFEPKPNVLSLT